MARLSILTVAAILALSLATGAAAQSSTAAARGSIEVLNAIAVRSSGEVIFQDIEITPHMPLANVTSTGMTNLTILGSGGDAISLAVPQSINAISQETGQSVTIVTNTQGEYAAITNFQTLLSLGGILSVDVGGAIQISSSELAPGEYRGLLVVVAQYN